MVIPYLVNGTEIETVTVKKDIGFWISNDLSTTTHVHKARGEKLHKSDGTSLTLTRAFFVLYNQRIRPHLDYVMSACPPDSAEEEKLFMFERAQAKATSLVHGITGLNAEERRQKLWPNDVGGSTRKRGPH